MSEDAHNITESQVIHSPAYYDLEWYPFVGRINGFPVFNSTKPRLTVEQYKAQQILLYGKLSAVINETLVMSDEIRNALKALKKDS